ncbi:hypothetical protein AGABI1DRAFT_105366 [Agaricus bisporus var. burnettii JB137-S8]|uniref:RhoGAP-domain-containing protein n=1 Tax=Agaricus bisporus var. burnettii (strain JB137-S8 / ATCC MYA-4627 / FGSC 10392) TaxID=597362 RepID=K5XF01_AGABU|nr:uncharacterized protein AGABI1DRAFT_105366 [Agaricus bisporus var. burnettii JB137-S8]EKM81978.1 hypothetical protein AGABI1DRAFT_105366 [Agaricus bisporus var. burnettii JB137-S8]
MATRDRLAPQSPLQPQRSSSSPSSSTSALPSSSTSTSLSHSQPLSSTSLLRQHEAAPDSKLAALEQAVNERNVLAAQNTQLWKLIEKQRSGYNQIIKELDRIRGERDAYKAKVVALGGSADRKSQKSADRKTRTEVDSGDAPSRQHSQDNSTPRLHSSRSYNESLRNNDSTSSTSINSGTLPPPPPSAPASSTPTSSKYQKSLPNAPSHSDSQPLPVSASASISSDEPPQIRKGSIAESISSVSSSMNYNASALTTATSSSIHSSSSPSANASSTTSVQITMSPASPQTPRVSLSQTSIKVEARPMLPPMDPRSSRITLPDEARQYIVNMVDSPSPSPKLDSFSSSKPKVSSNLVPQQQDDSSKPEASEFLDLEDDEEDAEDVELYEDEAEFRRSVHDQNQTKPTDSAVPDSRIDHSTTTPPDRQPHSDAPDFTNPFHDPQNTGQDISQVGVPSEDLSSTSSQHSLPPEFATDQSTEMDQATPGPHQLLINDNSGSSSIGPPSQPHHQFYHHTPLQQQPQQQQQMGPSHSNYPSVSLPPAYLSHQQMSQQQMMPVAAPPRTDSRPVVESTSTLSSLEPPPTRKRDREHYRALPLLPTDLPTTVVSVSHSSVRPNDRGKEVLWFVITVNPGSGKEPWKVEKRYSDVVTLDSRVRASVGKSVAKKITGLPEGKFWKDHAPAKVDQRKALLESYLQSLLKLPIRHNDEAIAFLTTDIVRETRQPVMQAGHKEGYLTKRGKNFGGWKTRYFVLQGPVLEYYESRGGTHLGSIVITGAQIGRQQRNSDRQNSNSNHNNPNGGSNYHDDEKEYRHAFLIVEAKKGPGGSHPRHVLCAESDEERDAWVEMLVRYFTGVYSEEPLNYGAPPPPVASSSHHFVKQPQRGLSKDEILVSKGVPLSQLQQDPSNAKLFSTPHNVDEINNLERPGSPVKSLDQLSIERQISQGGGQNSKSASNDTAKRVLERLQGLPSSLPDAPSMLSGVGNVEVVGGPRPNSEMGHYGRDGMTEMMDKRKSSRNHSPERYRYDVRKTSLYPSNSSNNNSSSNSNSNLSTPGSNNMNRSPSPDKMDGGGGASTTKPKISAPMGGQPIPSGFKWGGGESNVGGSGGDGGAGAGSNRREKARSRFWPGAWRQTNGEKQVAVVPRNVFGIPLEESLEVSQICNLPSIVFRSIEYLEAKKADQEEGIYRLSGSSAVIKSLKDRFNAEGDLNLLASDEYWDPHAIAGLLKSYLRELPASILTRELHFRFLSVIDFVDPQERIRELSQLIASLPIANYSILRALTAHLILIVQNASVNKMTMRNVGIVFSPTLGIPAGVFSLMLGEFNRVFNVDAGRDLDHHSAVASEDGLEPLHEEGGDDVSKRNRNSRHYSHAAADQILGLGGRSLNTSADDPQSDTDDYSVQDESGTETTGDGEMTAESVTGSISTPSRDRDHQDSFHYPHHQQQQHHTIRISGPPDTPVAARISKAASTANSKGLNLNAVGKRGTTSGLGGGLIGLPTSPRPMLSPSKADISAPPPPPQSSLG